MQRTQLIDGTPLVEKKAPPLGILLDTVAVSEGVEILGNDVIHRQVDGYGDGLNFRRGDIDRSGFTHAATAALLTGESKALVKKIGPLRQITQGDDRHGRNYIRSLAGIQL